MAVLEGCVAVLGCCLAASECRLVISEPRLAVSECRPVGPGRRLAVAGASGAGTGGVLVRGTYSPGPTSTTAVTTLPTPEIKDGRIFCPLLGDWLLAKPEEQVRQAFVLRLHEHYGYAFEQMAQEQRTQSGTRSPRVDIAVWATVEDAQRSPRPAPVLVVECKAETVDIHPVDFYQGESYARAVGEPCEFLVMHNARQTEFYRLRRGLPGEMIQINDIPHAADWGSTGRLDEIRKDLRAFSRREFQNLLHKCHGILRDNHKMAPGQAFDAISKVLFIKMYVERTGTHGTFSTEYLDERAKYVSRRDEEAHEVLFEDTKEHYQGDEIFAADDTLDISEATFRRLVRELERFNLSATGDDVKGLAFERFLGQTFRGNLGQYFTPRPVVDFMVDVLDPQIGELICDPAAGSGGFLIRAFEHVRDQIEAEVKAQKLEAKAEIEARGLPEDEEEEAIEQAFAVLNRDLDPDQEAPPSRLRQLSRDHVYGTDAEARAARTAKMNMIMHGDGHGGIHYHDGLVDVNGIFPDRFDVVLSNPPFGSTVGDDQIVGETEQTRGPSDPAIVKRARSRYGDGWEAAHRAFQATAKDGKRTNKQGDLPVLSLYDIGLGKGGQKTELLFLERCLQLLKPGGRLGVVLPDGNLNNPSAQWADVRRWAEGRARLMAVVSLPQDTFGVGQGVGGVFAPVYGGGRGGVGVGMGRRARGARRGVRGTANKGRGGAHPGDRNGRGRGHRAFARGPGRSRGGAGRDRVGAGRAAAVPPRPGIVVNGERDVPPAAKGERQRRGQGGREGAAGACQGGLDGGARRGRQEGGEGASEGAPADRRGASGGAVGLGAGGVRLSGVHGRPVDGGRDLDG